jgi:tRNA dimethylallyltransferase
MQSTTPSLPILCLMGPTASGKTPLAVELVQHFPCEIISVDSAMVYRGMDIGTAKPTQDVLQLAPHRLIDKLDPKEAYSAGQFRLDALHEIKDILAHGKVPLLVGGTMLYFRVLQLGLAELPTADANLRATLKARAAVEGWEALHAYLASVDAKAALRIQPRDSQRIQRALEVYLLTGKTITAWQRENTSPLSGYRVHTLALIPSDRARLHERIAARFEQMLHQGLVQEVRDLYERGDLFEDLPSIRSVGYRQLWAYLAGEMTLEEAKEKAVIATRQLAKRQLTWLRSWPEMTALDSASATIYREAAAWLKRQLF